MCRAQAADVKRMRVPGSSEDQWFLEVSQTKSKRVRRVPLTPELVKEVRLKVGLLVGFATGSPGSFAAQARKRTGVAGFHVHQMRHYAARRIMPHGARKAQEVG